MAAATNATQTARSNVAPGLTEVGFDPACELCEAAPLTERFLDNDLCWVAECEMCAVPMVVWRCHDPDPPPAIRARLMECLSTVVETHFGYELWIDDNMRSIPDHYHAHARPRNGFYGHGLRRRAQPTSQPTEGMINE